MGRRLTLSLLLAAALAALASPRAAVAADEPPVVDRLDRAILVLDPVPGAVPHPSRVKFSGRLLAGWKSPAVAFIRPNGRGEYLLPKDVRIDGDRFETTLPLVHGKGAYRIEVSATDAQGHTRSAARLRIFAGAPIAREEDALPKDDAVARDVSTFVLERRLYLKILALRKSADVDPLPWLEPLAEVARDHAAACAKANRNDQVVDAEGDLAKRVGSKLGWKGVVAQLPLAAPSPGAAGQVFLDAAIRDTASLEGLLARWGREPAVLVPLSSTVLSHLAVGIARSGDRLFAVVAFAQIGRDDVSKSIEVRYDTLLDDARKASAQAKPDLLRELARWGRKEGPRECAKAASSADLDLRAAALDGQFLADGEGTTRAIAALVAKMDADTAAWTSRCRYAFPAARAAAAFSQAGR